MMVVTLSVLMSATEAQNATPVTVGTATLAPIIEEVSLTGTVTSPKAAQLSTAVEGLVERVYVDAGDRVEQGKVLLVLDPEIEEINLRRERAAIREAEAELADARQRLRDAQQVKQLGITEQAVRSLQAEVRIDQAALERLQAEAQRQTALLERHQLKAPFSGVVNRKLTESGEWVEPGTAVFELVATDGLRLDFQVSQEYFPRIDDRSVVQVTLDALPGQQFQAHISAVVPVSNRNARTFIIRVLLDDATVPIIPGMSAQGVLRLATGERGVVVSRDALVRYPDGRITVWRVNESQTPPTVAEQRIRTGRAFSDRVEITAGLEPGTRIVLRGNEVLQNGQTIDIQGDS